ncbi:dephospho-CoA kinase [Clostridium botulinum]|uniref:Dephospho-CoA kinase n=1 Tax=Clostridium botulinum (strain Eklund 17B / Type B) TaxID=935198 RepID=B2TNM5_CLOBB|nr:MULTISPECIES: dephospho-CoA kinase [Clostridium]ACD23653.1 dephospho-CoA kinase [Clostridium botulinum B str. Eklund 17B (NRP)]AIY81011.1 dephospho-CoA kinase [Clostridium botulinum 202F]KAI3346694.1 dephospho-CoA kinase [Clostridium botulinum]KFX53787.1 dephospho-CoA kinase [Clostridium botulinum]KFX57264.1 dephospho-CoA kinase [Clostridium botulinum]
MIKIGLTGGIGTGKSTISDIFRSENFNIIDADVIAREVLQKNPQILDVIRNEFGTGFFDWRGEFRRREFGNHIFKFPKQRVKYESIIMPYIKEAINNAINSYEKKGDKVVIIDAPTLIENNMHEEMDYVVLVCAENSAQIKRVRDRDNLSKIEVVSRINAQMSLNEKKNFANVIIDNNGDLIETQKQVYDLIDYINSL